MITEKLLHYLWKHQLFTNESLKATDGQTLKIMHAGFPHHDAGPDFKQAVIKIGEISWAGDVEVHIRSSDWMKHKHQEDKKYNSVILHVVYQDDKMINIHEKEPLPTLELKPLISSQLLLRYLQLSESPTPMPCVAYIKSITPLNFIAFLSRLAIDRMARKQKLIFETLKFYAQDWEATVFHILGQSLGCKTNAPGFELLCKSLPYKYLKQHSKSQLQTYSLIFGQAGMLEEDPPDEYYQLLQNEYLYLRQKYKLVPIDAKCWNLLRLRPPNFPCVRLAQLAELIHQSPNLFDTICSQIITIDFRNLFVFEPHSYWKTHYQFGKESNCSEKMMGEKSFQLVMINAISPLLYTYGVFFGNERFIEWSVNMLEKLPYEQNHITKNYQHLGFPCVNASHSQALLELYHNYCEKRNCVECVVGQKIISC